jgi:hypothetical protein
MRDLDRRLRILESRPTRWLDDEEMAKISDEDLEWMMSRPKNAAETNFDFSKWTEAELERAEAIGSAAKAAAKVVDHVSIAGRI